MKWINNYVYEFVYFKNCRYLKIQELKKVGFKQWILFMRFTLCHQVQVQIWLGLMSLTVEGNQFLNLLVFKQMSVNKQGVSTVEVKNVEMWTNASMEAIFKAYLCL